jgi:hypothetical protein
LALVAVGSNLFILEKAIPIPISSSLLEAQLSAFLGWLWNINSLFKEMITHIDSFMKISKEGELLQIDSEPSPTTSSQEPLPSKRQRTN